MTRWRDRFFCLQSHYRKSLVFTWENLDNAVAAYNKLIAKIANIKDEGGVDEDGARRVPRKVHGRKWTTTSTPPWA